MWPQILTEAGMPDLHDRLQEHYTEVVLKTACKLQSWDIPESRQLNKICDDFGMSLYDSMKNLQPEEVPVKQKSCVFLKCLCYGLYGSIAVTR